MRLAAPTPKSERTAGATHAERLIVSVGAAEARRVLDRQRKWWGPDFCAGFEEALPADCAWCGAAIDGAARRWRSSRGELFDSKAHRDASARAVRRLRDGA